MYFTISTNVALAIGLFPCTAIIQGEKDYLCTEPLYMLNSTLVLIRTFFKLLTVPASGADLALLRKQPINFTINLQLVVNPAWLACCFLPLYIFSQKVAINWRRGNPEQPLTSHTWSFASPFIEEHHSICAIYFMQVARTPLTNPNHNSLVFICLNTEDASTG